MSQSNKNRCLYISELCQFIESDPYSILGRIQDAFHGHALTTTIEAWIGEIKILQDALLPWKNEEYDTQPVRIITESI